MSFKENRLLIISLVVIVGGVFWAISTSKSSSGNTTAQSVESLELGDVYSKGDPNAPVKVVQYSDFLCPSCSQVSLGIMPQIEEEYVNTGKVHFQFRPLAFIAAGSQTAAEGAYCAADQNKFWEYHDAAYEAVWTGYFSKGVDPSQVPLYSKDGVIAIAKAAGITDETFGACVNNGTNTQKVSAYTNKAQQEGISSTPYFEVNGKAIKGVPSYDVLVAAIKAAGGK